VEITEIVLFCERQNSGERRPFPKEYLSGNEPVRTFRKRRQSSKDDRRNESSRYFVEQFIYYPNE
jgi:hypothetical protein